VEATGGRLPEFESPPLDEVVIGVQFNPLPKFSSVYFGRFWERIRDRYPKTQDQPPIGRQQEFAELQPIQQRFMAVEAGAHLARCWFLDDSERRIVQLQPDRFLRNWRQLKGDEPYPRFANLIAEFKTEWIEFQKFAKAEALGDVVLNFCEL